MKRITLTVGLDVDHDTRLDDVIREVTDAIAEHVTLADQLRYTSDGVHIALASPPAPSGWQQRIAAAERLSVRVRRHLRDVSDCRHSDRSDEGGGLVCIACVEAAIDSCANEPGQNAKDALPPSSSPPSKEPRDGQ